MAELTTDEEKVEAIKKWWKDNGTAVVAGVVIGLGLVFGWRAWVNHQEQVGQRASLAFEQLLMAASSGQGEIALSQAEALNEAYPDGPYAALADLVRAQVLVEQDDLDAAVESLRAAQKAAPNPGLAKLAALRLAQVLIAQEDYEAASKVIEAQDDDTAFSADFAGLRGDIFAAQGEFEAAREAYAQAIAGGAGLSRLIQLKLNDLPAAPETAS
jgi:predicted negative regulator of RcsB-dependent stress response